MKSPISEDIAIAVLLKSLPDTYATLVTTFKYHNNPTLEGIINALQEEERTQQQKVTDTAFLAKKGSSKVRKPCTHCGKTNHMEKDCFKAHPCTICGRDNHREKDCYSKPSTSAPASTSAHVAAASPLAHLAVHSSYDEKWAF